MKSTGKSKTTSRSASPVKRTTARKAPTSVTPRASAKKSAAPAASRTGSAARPRREEIALRAYELFVRSGYRHGRDLEHWLEAERQLKTSVK